MHSRSRHLSLSNEPVCKKIVPGQTGRTFLSPPQTRMQIAKPDKARHYRSLIHYISTPRSLRTPCVQVMSGAKCLREGNSFPNQDSEWFFHCRGDSFNLWQLHQNSVGHLPLPPSAPLAFPFPTRVSPIGLSTISIQYGKGFLWKNTLNLYIPWY